MVKSSPIDDALEGYLSVLKELFNHMGCPDREIAMSKYMRNQFSFFGVPSPQRKEIQSIWVKSLPKDWNQTTKWKMVHLLWNQPQRELHYVAIDWMNTWKATSIEPQDIHHFTRILTTHSWWDSIDGLAPGIIGKFIQENPKEGYQWIAQWRKNSDFWLRRTCIIFQLKFRENVDFELLKSIIRENVHDKEFFIQKAIGWSLRQHARCDAQSVVNFVHTENIIGLAKREALKHINDLG
jgi:3-methyladenine DNA glycosylase AlkD